MAEKVKKKAKQLEEELEDIEYEEAEGEEGGGFEAFIENNRTLVFSVLGGIALVLLGILGYRYYQQSQNSAAQTEMFQSIYYSQSDSTRLALQGDGIHAGLLDIIDDYSGTPAADQAAYLAGINYFKQGDAGTAIDYLEQVPNEDNMLTFAKYLALGFAYQQLGELEAAAKSFERASDYPDENEYTTPMALQLAGETYEALEDTDKARKLYRRIKEEYPQSKEGSNIDKYLGRVGG